jgi:DMSO/TMAO reductase YedYZ molybdopterin-dependent catalytic subunit
MIVRSSRPEDLEMPLDGFGMWLTPVERFFVRCHTFIPKVDSREWNLKVGGLVDHPITLTMEDIKKFPRIEMASVLECAGSGRGFYQPPVPGTQWTYGAIGNAVWAGVRLRDVLQKAGLKAGAQTVLFDGADVPLGKMPDFQRTITASKALHPDTLLAYEMNGQVLPVEHGFPLRLIAPGWAGDSWVKWVQRIDVLDHEFEGFWMKTAYRHPLHPILPGASVDPKDMVPVADLNVNSVVTNPAAWTKPGKVRVQGMAWSNSSPVAAVSVSWDNGKTWRAAELAGPRTKYGWRTWRYTWKASPGEYSLIARATNAKGETQPLKQEWNPSGYLWNVAQPIKVVVSDRASEAPASAGSEISTAPPENYSACLACHDEHMMSQQHLTPAQWEREVDKMIGWGAGVKPQDRGAIVKYLSGQFKPH